MRLYVLRHGDAAYEPYVYGVAKSLSELGREQARRTGEAMTGYGITHVYASTVPRTQQTAEAVAAALELPVEHSDEWVEHLIPAIDGLTLAEVREHWPHLAPDRSDQPWWERDFGPEGESFPRLFERAQRAWRWFVQRHGTSDDVPLLVTHGGFADFFLQSALGLTPSRHLFRFRNTGLAVLTCGADGLADVEFPPLPGVPYTGWGTGSVS